MRNAMKLFISLLVANLGYQLLFASAPIKQPSFELKLTATWYQFDQTSNTKPIFEGKWTYVGNIMLKKRSPEQIALKRLVLKWRPQKRPRKNFSIANLNGSLYKIHYKQQLLPIEELVLCDGTWNQEHQCLIFEFDEEFILDPVNEFHLILTIPEKIESILKHGYFKIEETSLPPQFKKQATKQQLKLAHTMP